MNDYDTFNGDSAGFGEPTLEMQDLKSPRREILHQIIPNARESALTNNSTNLQQAATMQLSAAFVQLGPSGGSGGLKSAQSATDPVTMNNSGKAATIEFGHPLNN